MLEKYNDRKCLTNYDLCTDLFSEFGLTVHDVIPLRRVYMVSTDKGEKILKKVEYTCEELDFIDSILNYIKNKFPRVMSFIKNKDGNIYTIWNGNMYCIMDLVEGKECDFCSPVDLVVASRALGELHLASEGFKTNLSSKYQNGKLIDKFNRRIQEMTFFNSIANSHESKSEFDEIFINNVDYYVQQIKKSINMLEKSYYYKLCGEEDKIVICHHDLAHHNILINSGEAYFIDFDYAIIDLKIHDLCNFINKVVKNFAFDIEKAQDIIQNYCTKNTLSNREIEVLYSMLTFPDDFYSISKDYYAKRKDWYESTFLEKLKKKVGYKDEREEFLEQFSKIIH